MVLCTERSLVKHDRSVITIKPLRCKCWGCDHCVHGKRRDLWHKAVGGVPRIFLTLTMPHSTASPEAQAKEFVLAFRMLRQFLCRRLGRKALTFLAVFERHPKSGWPHLHVLLRGGYISRKLILEFWTNYTGAVIVDIRLAKGKRQVANYVSKYVSKDPGKFDGVKRFWCSQDWSPKRKAEAASAHDEFTWWESISLHPLGLARCAYEDGAAITFRDGGWLIERWSAADRARWGIGW